MAQEQFNKFVIKLDGCWKWIGGKDRSGYGVFRYQGRAQGAHRVAYELYKDPISNGLHVLHTCDNPECTNPEHLFLGTNLDNVKDRISKGRRVGRLKVLDANSKSQLEDLINCGLFSKRTIAHMWGVSRMAINRINTYNYKT